MINPASKIKSLKELSLIINKIKTNGEKVILGHGIFDLMHYGHIHYLEQAKKMGDVLVVSILVNKFVTKGSGRPVFNEKIRARFVAALGCVDYVVLCRNFGPWDILEEIRPHIFAKGDDSKRQLKDPNSGLNKDKKIVESWGGFLRFTKSLPIHSTELLKKYAENYSTENEFT